MRLNAGRAVGDGSEGGSSFSHAGFLARALAAHGLLAIAAGGLMLLSAAIVVAVGAGAKQLIDGGAWWELPRLPSSPVLALVAGLTVLPVVIFGRDQAIAVLGEDVALDLRQQLFGTLLAATPGFFETAAAGDLLTRLTVDIGRVQDFIGGNLFRAARSLLCLGAALVMALLLDAAFAAVIAGLTAAVVVAAVLMEASARPLALAAQEDAAAVAAFCEQSLATVKTIQMFVLERSQQSRFGVLLDAARAAALRRRCRSNLTAAVALVLAMLAVGAAAGFGLHQLATGRQTAGGLTSFLTFVGLVVVSCGTLLDAWAQFQPTMAAVERIRTILDRGRASAGHAGGVPLPPAASGTIRLEDVTVRYPSRPGQAALDQVSLTIEGGRAVALLGASGSGKSTVLDLLGRFVSPSEGVVSIDGVDLARIDTGSLRDLIGFVPQDPVIVGADVWDNIRLGRPTATMREVRRAAEMASATAFIEALPHGFATLLGEKGSRLSGGQRQRLALARALLREPRILLLDEVTSALDPETTAVVADAVAAFARSRTAIVVTHSPAMARRFERIVVLRDGRIAADGSHAQLLRESPLYRKFTGVPPISSAA